MSKPVGYRNFFFITLLLFVTILPCFHDGGRHPKPRHDAKIPLDNPGAVVVGTPMGRHDPLFFKKLSFSRLHYLPAGGRRLSAFHGWEDQIFLFSKADLEKVPSTRSMERERSQARTDISQISAIFFSMMIRAGKLLERYETGAFMSRTFSHGLYRPAGAKSAFDIFKGVV